jgi:TrmH family RNA methyltransferase
VISNNQIKQIRSLKQKKFRQKYDNFIVEGYKSCFEFLKSKKYEIISLFIGESWASTNQSFLEEYSQFASIVPDKDLQRISLLSTPSDMLMVCKITSRKVNLLSHKMNRVFFLDEVQDPGNVGTIIRTADWFGFDAVIASHGTADFYNPKVVQATMGSMCNVELISGDIKDMVLAFPEFKLIGTDVNGISLHAYQWPQKSIIVLGNEGRGMSLSTMDILNGVVTISGVPDKIAESLNVAQAAAIIAYASTR